MCLSTGFQSSIMVIDSQLQSDRHLCVGETRNKPVSDHHLETCLVKVIVFHSNQKIEITSWKVRAYDFYSRVEFYRKTNE